MTANTTVPAACCKILCLMEGYLTETAPILILFGVLTTSVLAQGPTADVGSTRSTVAYVEVQSTAVASMRAAFDRYRAASRMESGFEALELLQQSGNPGLFVVIERWRDQASIDTHANAASTMRFRDALVPIRVSGYDERPYKTFATGSTRPGSSGAVAVISHIDVVPPGDAGALLRRLAELSRGEAGCLRFDILQHAARANHFTIIEVWRNQQARDAHAAAAHTRQYREALQPLIGSPLDERLMRPVP